MEFAIFLQFSIKYYIIYRTILGRRGTKYYNIQDFSNREVKRLSRLLNNKYIIFLAAIIIVILKVKLIFIIPLKLKKIAIDNISTPAPIKQRHYISKLEE